MSYHIRTTLYSTFIILLINFTFVLFLISKNNKLLYALISILAINFSIQFSHIKNLDSIKENRLDYYNFYFYNLNNQNYTNISDILNKIDKNTNGNKIIFDSNLSEDIYYVYSENKLKEVKFKKLRPIKNLIHYQNNKTLDNYFKKINFKKIKFENGFMISIDKSNVDVINNFKMLEKSKVFLNNCKISNNPILNENIFIHGRKKIFLHKVTCY